MVGGGVTGGHAALIAAFPVYCSGRVIILFFRIITGVEMGEAIAVQAVA